MERTNEMRPKTFIACTLLALVGCTYPGAPPLTADHPASPEAPGGMLPAFELVDSSPFDAPEQPKKQDPAPQGHGHHHMHGGHR